MNTRRILAASAAVDDGLPKERQTRRNASRREFTTPALIALLGVLAAACGDGTGEGSDESSLNSVPVASFTATPTSGAVPLTVQFNASASTDTGGSIATYSWNYGDNSGPHIAGVRILSGTWV